MAFEGKVVHQLYQIRADVLVESYGGGDLSSVAWGVLGRQLADTGFNILYLLGVWETGEAGLQKSRAVLGDDAANARSSPFAVTAYRVAATLGGDDALRRAREALNAVGVSLMVDFVPNHVALDSEWLLEHNDWFMHGDEGKLASQPDVYFRPSELAGPFLPGSDIPSSMVLAHGRDPNFGGWTDTIQLNYWSPDTRQAMTDVLKHITSLADGVRCDMAMLVTNGVFGRTWGRPGSVAELPEFWPAAIAACKAISPEFLFMAEVYWDMESDLQAQGFDYTYDKRLLDRLEGVDGPGVVGHLRADAGFQAKSARFIENHDEKRAATAFGTPQHHFAAAVVTMTVPGLRFFHDGQLSGRRVFHSMHAAARTEEAEDAPVAGFFTRLLRALMAPAFRQGTYFRCDVAPSDDGNPSHAAIVAHAWLPRVAAPEVAVFRSSSVVSRACAYVVVVNVSNSSSDGHVVLPPELGPKLLLVDVVGGGEALSRDVSPKGIWFGLGAFEHHVYACTPSTSQ